MAHPQKPTSFLDLPPELRNNIYMLVLPVDQRMEMHVKNLPGKHLGVVHVGGQVGAEASAIYFGANTFRATSFQATYRFLKYVGAERRDMIRRMEVTVVRTRAGTRLTALKRVVSVLNGLGDHEVDGLRAEAVFIRVESADGWICLTESEELDVVETEGGWEVKPGPEWSEAEARAAKQMQEPREHWWRYKEAEGGDWRRGSQRRMASTRSLAQGG